MQRYEDDEPRPTIQWAVAFGKTITGRSLRQIAAISNVSAGQLSRLATGKSSSPSVETVVALAPALGIHPTCLLTLAGHLAGAQARRALSELIEQAADAIVETYDAAHLAALRDRLANAADDEALRLFATDVITHPVPDVDFPDALAPLTAGRLPDAALLDEIIRAWPGLTPDRRWRLVELTRDLHRVSIGEHDLTGKDAT